MAKPTHAPMFGEATAVETPDGTEVGVIAIRKIVTQHVPVVTGKGGTFGQILDAQLEEAAMAGEEVQSIEVEIAPNAWKTFSAIVRGA